MQYLSDKQISTLSFIILLLLPNISYSSAWTKSEKEIFGNIEYYVESDSLSTYFKNKNSNFYKTDYLQTYFEYGLFENLTVGGYLKKYNFYSKYYGQDDIIVKNINNDYYGNLFLIQNIYKTAKDTLSIQYSVYFPIKYSNLSKMINPVDARFGYEMSLSYGGNNNFSDYLNYFFEFKGSYKIINNMNEDKLAINATLGIRLNKTSSFSIRYENDNYPNTLLSKNKSYNYNKPKTTNKIKFSNNYKFSDDYSLEFSYYRIFPGSAVNALSASIIFNY